MSMPAPFAFGYYREMLREARVQGYVVSSFARHDASNPRTAILRHDVDYTLNGVAELAAIEHEAGVSATYLFRLHANECSLFAPHVYMLIQRLCDLGRQIGLRLEAMTIARAIGVGSGVLVRKQRLSRPNPGRLALRARRADRRRPAMDSGG